MKKIISILLFSLITNFLIAQKFQSLIEDNSKDIETYYLAKKNLKNKRNIIKNYQEQKKLITKFEEALIKLSNTESTKIINDSIKIILKKDKSIQKLNKSFEESKKLFELYNSLDGYKKKKIKASNIINKEVTNLKSGSKIKFKYKGINYTAFILDLTKQDINIALADEENKKLVTINRAYNYYSKTKKKDVLMICNAGMYQRDSNPVGLLISNGKKLKDVTDNSKKISDNYHMYPNGIFYIKNNKASIIETEKYITDKKSNESSISQATQSGPMLVINNEHHKRFNYGSKNLHIRNGVGILADERIIFIISNERVNFFDFSTVFQDVFGCKNALYLDGAISKMYIKGDKKNSMGNGTFGPFIVITDKVKIQKEEVIKINK